VQSERITKNKVFFLGNDIAVGINMAITVISYAPVGHSYFHTPPAFQATPSILEGELASRSTASRSAFDGKETAPPLR
jgi:uncharacterized protein (DUF2126 family)